MSKSPDAFRTISEVADWLGVQAHVLRFWESKFSQVKPIKRAGGRRYYRPADMLLLGGLKQLLHEDGLTIKGAQKLLREKGVAHVADLSQPLDDLTMAALDEDAVPEATEPAFSKQEGPGPDDADDAEAEDAPEPETHEAVAGEPVADDDGRPAVEEPQDATGQPETVAGSEPEPEPEPQRELEPGPAPEENTADAADAQALEAEDDPAAESGSEKDETSFEFAPVAEAQTDAGDAADDAPDPEFAGDDDETAEDGSDAATTDLPDFLTKPLQGTGDADAEETGSDVDADPAEEEEDISAGAPDEETVPEPDNAGGDDAPAADNEDEGDDGPFTVTPPVRSEKPLRPAQVDVPPVPAEEDIVAQPSALSALSRLHTLDRDQARRIRPLLEQLVALRADRTGPGKDAGKD